jgi:hypothetical protein
MTVAQQDMRFCVTQWNKKCLKSFKAFVPFGLKRKRKNKKNNLMLLAINPRLFLCFLIRMTKKISLEVI